MRATKKRKNADKFCTNKENTTSMCRSNDKVKTSSRDAPQSSFSYPINHPGSNENEQLVVYMPPRNALHDISNGNLHSQDSQYIYSSSSIFQDKGKRILGTPLLNASNALQQLRCSKPYSIENGKLLGDICKEVRQKRINILANKKNKNYQRSSLEKSNGQDSPIPSSLNVHKSTLQTKSSNHVIPVQGLSSPTTNISSCITPSTNTKIKNAKLTPLGYNTPISVLDNQFLASGSRSPNVGTPFSTRFSAFPGTPTTDPRDNNSSNIYLSSPNQFSQPKKVAHKNKKCKSRVNMINELRPKSVLDNQFLASGSRLPNLNTPCSTWFSAIHGTPTTNPKDNSRSNVYLNSPNQASQPKKVRTKDNKRKSRVDVINKFQPIAIEIPHDQSDCYFAEFKKVYGISKDYLDHGDPTYVCSYCHAAVWNVESLKGNKKTVSLGYSICCSHGKIQLPPTPRPPNLLKRLFENKHPKSKNFIQNIRAYNMMFSFTSMGGKIDTAVNTRKGPYCFRLSGQNCHFMGSLLPLIGRNPRFSQLYIYDTENEAQNRINAVSSGCRDASSGEPLDPELIEELKNLLNDVNPLVVSYRMARDRFAKDGQQTIRLRLIGSRERDGRTYNLPTSSEVAGIIIGDIDAAFDERDIIVETQSGKLQRISELHPSYISLQYPLLFPLGQDGYRRGILHRDVDENNKTGRAELTIREFFAYYIQERFDQPSLIHIGRRLFQQFLVDAYTMIESDRLSFIRHQQKKLRLDTFKNLERNVVSGNTEASKTGQRILLPSSFTGGSRYMMQNYLDAMAIVRHFGYPDLFITFTCNPKWPEITRFFKNKNTSPEDRPDILCRIFKIKLDSMIKDFKKTKVFGDVDAVVYTIEFQKRGLPHSHICLFLKSAYKFPTAQHVDLVIRAEIPDKREDPELYELVSDFMIHGPCGEDNMSSPCMKKGKCSKNYPRPFKEHTTVDEDGYPLYRRRDNGANLYKGKVKVDNRFVVPYNAFLLKRYQAHINVEWCNQSGAIKYLFKYINKGHDRITAGVITNNSDVNGQVQERNVDEIKEYYDCRYISACEASWRIFGNELHHRTPAVERLSFHLPGEQPIIYEDDADLENVIGKPTVAASMFTSWMEQNKVDEDARKLTYIEFPQKYVWNPSERIWTRRKQKLKLGRIHHVPPSMGEAYYLRCLLNKVRGAQCFEDISKVRGTIYSTFRDACFELGILDDDREYIDGICEASEWASGQYLRSLFVMLLLSKTISRPDHVWTRCRDYLADGILHKQRKAINYSSLTMEPEEVYNYTLYEIEKILRTSGSTLKNFVGMPNPPDEFIVSATNRLIYDELHYDRKEMKEEHDKLFGSLTSEQKDIYDRIITRVDEDGGGAFFVYGYGGTGKTFLWKTLSTAIRSKGKIVLNVASSGIASLLLSGGRTAHSRFVIPINVTEDSVCSINQDSPLAELLKLTSLIIWDEAPMIHKHCFEALDRTLRDILRSTVPNSEDKPFGGKVVVFGGDFRQILPVVPKGSRQDIVNASLNSSYLWDHIEVLKLSVNMRLQSESNSDDIKEIKDFADWILEVGNGTAGGPNDGEADITIPDEFLIDGDGDPLMSIISTTYPNVINNLYEPTYFQERAILAPTHEQVDKINERLLSMVPGDETVYLSSDSICESENSGQDETGMGSPEFLNSLKFSGVPNHCLALKVGIPIMLLRNIDQPNGLCNGTRLTILKLDKMLIKARVITGTNVGFETIIPRMKLSPSDKTLPFKMIRKQFPIAVCFAMTINKSQGQTLSQVGLFLPRPVFTHGQLYVAISRVKSKKGLKILICDNDMNVSNTTKNVVYKEVLRNM